MKENFIKFGDMEPTICKKARSPQGKRSRVVTEDGLESNSFTTYDCEVKFENIKTRVNVCRVKDDDHSTGVGVAKGAILAGIPLTVPTNDAGATTHAMKKRCDYKPGLKTIESFVEGHKLLMAKFTPQETIRVDRDLMDEYFAQCDSSKAARLLEVLNEEEWRSEMDSKHVFAKQEALLKEHKAQPRVVYQGTDMYNALTGPVIMELNRRMKETFSLRNPLNTGNIALYACGMRGEELGEIMEQAEGTAIESDAKNNDGSQPAELRKYEAMFYKKLGAPDWFVREFAKCTKVRVWTRYGICAEVNGERWSGETTTTTGNSYTHMALMQASLQKAGITQSTNIHGGDDYLGFVKGDEVKFQASVEEVFDDTGMVAEVAVQQNPLTATFYRKRYIRGRIGCRPVPQFGRVLAKLNIRPNRNTNVNDRDYMAGKYLSAAYEHRHVPMIKDLLLQTSAQLSETPYLDVRTSKLKEMGGRTNVCGIVERSVTHDVDDFADYLQVVYGISVDSLLSVYEASAASCLEYCDKWTVVDKKGKTVNRKGNSSYSPPKMCGDTVDALTRIDIGQF